MGYSLKELQLSMNIEKKRAKNAHKEGKKLSSIKWRWWLIIINEFKYSKNMKLRRKPKGN